MIELEVITPERQLFKVACEAVTLPGREGELEVLEGHAPILVSLKTGVLSLKGSETGELKYSRIMVSGGFAEVDHKHVRVLAELAATPEEVDIKSEQELVAKMQEKLQKLQEADEKEFKHLQAEIERSTAKLRIV